MTSMLRISDAASLAIHTMAVLAQAEGRLVTTHEIAEELGVSENHLAKVRQRLAKSRLVSATRGPRGGFKLCEAPDKITLMRVYEAIEGEYKPEKCLLHKPVCRGKKCIMGDLVVRINRQVSDFLRNTTVSELAGTGGQ